MALRPRLATGLPFRIHQNVYGILYPLDAPINVKCYTPGRLKAPLYGLYWPNTSRSVSETSPNVASSPKASFIG